MAPRKKKEEIAKEETKVEVEEKALSPSEYFDILKGRRQESKIEELQALYDNACTLMARYKITGQKSGALKLYKFVDLCAKEIKAVKCGVNTYIDRRDIDEYIANIASKTVVIIELENYERVVPDDVIDKIAELKENNVFDAYYVIFTDYTGKERKKVEAKRREKDPILVGAMKIGEQLNTRMYYIASWEDEYCDLTLDKMVSEFAKRNEKSPVQDIKSIYPTLEDFKRGFEESTKK